MAVRRALASLDSSSTRALTTVVACERTDLGRNSKPLTDFCTSARRFWASFWTPSMRFCASVTTTLTVSIARSAAPTDACRPRWASDLMSNLALAMSISFCCGSGWVVVRASGGVGRLGDIGLALGAVERQERGVDVEQRLLLALGQVGLAEDRELHRTPHAVGRVDDPGPHVEGLCGDPH